MTQYLSDKLRIISFVSIILVLYRHSDFHDYPHEILGMPYNHYLQDFIYRMIGRCAVPTFFAISGYLFFLHTEEGYHSVLKKIKKRIKTILVPFAIASLVFPFFFFVISFFPQSANFINNDILSQIKGKETLEVIKALFLDSGTGEPLAFHLWFLRDLIGIVAISPLLYGIKKILPIAIPSLLCIIVASILPQIVFLTSAFWFVFGSEFLVHWSKIDSRFIPFIFLLLCFAELLYPNEFWNNVRLPVICIGVVTMWNVYDRVVGKTFCLSMHHWLSFVCSFTFFIYLYHEPIINVIRKLLVLGLGKSPFGFAIAYLLSPWVTASFMLLIGCLFKRCCPRIYGILVGGR